jgi:sulfatase maturation enzyme AslB (radical SAM superfamily)
MTDDTIVAKPCCWYQEGVAFTSADKARSEFENFTTWPRGCSTCQQQESAGFHSFRQASFDIVEDVPHNKTVALDINVDYNCNAACVICNPDWSSTWHKQYTQNVIPVKQIDFKVTDYITDLIDNIDYSEVRRIKFFGGEPLLGDTHLRALDKIPDPSLVSIWYTTNGSIQLNDTILKTWEKFKLVFVEISIDGIEQQFDYLRWPLTWNKITRNMFSMRDQVPNNVLFRVNHTLNPFNIYYYDRLDNWFKENFNSNKCGDPLEINIHPAWGDWALARTPAALRGKVYEKYGDSAISNLLKGLPQHPHDSILKFIDKWEPIRKNNWESVFPEIVDFFKIQSNQQESGDNPAS